MKELPLSSASVHQTIAIYGDFGAGKTALAATAPKPIFLDSDEGTMSSAERFGLDHVRRVPIHEATRDMEEAYNRATGTNPKRSWQGRYESVVWDRFDVMQAKVLDELGEAAAAKDSRRDPDAIEQREWGIMAGRLNRYVRKWKALPYHKLFICGAKYSDDEGKYMPSLTGRLRIDLPGLCDHVMFLRVDKKGRRWLHLDATEEAYAKTRAWWLPDDMRKMLVDFNDPSALTRLFTAIAKGPAHASTTKRSSTTKGTKRSTTTN